MNGRCCICSEEGETFKHAFGSCVYMRTVWNFYYSSFDLDSALNFSDFDFGCAILAWASLVQRFVCCFGVFG